MEWQGAFVSMRKKYGDDVHAYVLSSMDNGYFKDLKLALANTCGYEKPSGEKLRVRFFTVISQSVVYYCSILKPFYVS